MSEETSELGFRSPHCWILRDVYGMVPVLKDLVFWNRRAEGLGYFLLVIT